VLSILVAFLPAAVLGLALHDIIKQVFFESPMLICVSLILGGIVLLVIDRFAPYPTKKDAMALPLGTSLAIGFFQCLALFPGVSRSGATIVGSMIMGVEKRVAAEFSFLLAIPVMAGAFTVDAWKNRAQLSTQHIDLVAVGFVVSFLVALVVIRGMLAIVTRRGFAPFGWLRIAVGVVGLALLKFAA
jgi:undecaprenyl-diphosphatase